MKILLIDPPWIIENKENLWSKIGSCLPSLGLAYIAAVLEQAGHNVKIIDCNVESIKYYNYIDYDYIGLTATTPLIDNALDIAGRFKIQSPDIKIIIGGVHASVKPDEVLSNKYVDYVVRGEGEITFTELVDGKHLNTISGLSYKINGVINHNKDRPLIKDLNTLPIPAYHLFPIKYYKPAIGSYKRLPAMSIFATRGCPGECSFCFNPYKYARTRNARNIIKEIKYLQKYHGIKEISFYDDTFVLFKKNVKEFCEIMIKEKIDITWSCFSRVDVVDIMTLSLMKKAGCHLMLFGVESSNKEVLSNIKKNITISQVKKAIKLCKQVGIETRASYMFGNKGETVQTIKDTIKFSIELDTDTAQYNIATPYPGTEFHQWCEDNNLMKQLAYSEYTVSEVLFNHPSVSEKELKKYYKLAHRKFYFRLKVIFRRLFKIRNFTQLIQEIKGAIAVGK